MRYRLVQVVVLVAACALAAKPLVHAQTCPRPSVPEDGQASGPEISIAQVTFSGALQLATSDQDQIAASIKEQTHGNSLDEATDEALERVRSGWQDHGYFKVQVDGDATTLTRSPSSQRIALRVHVEEGRQYSLGGIKFRHNRAVSNVEALRALFPIHDGDVFSREKTATGLQNLSKAYGQLGYINFTSIPDTKFDDEQKLIYLDIDVDEGKQFYVGNVNVVGLDEVAGQELLKDLPITQGQVFNSRLWELSLLKLGPRLPDCGCADRQVRALDERAGTVTLTFDFRPCSGDQ